MPESATHYIHKKSQLEKIGDTCFYGSGIGEITLPSTLRKIDINAFDECDNLKTIYVEDSCKASLVDAGMSDSVNVIPLSAPMIGGIAIQDLRQMKDVVIPKGTEKIESYLFWGSRVESVAVPASVIEIGVEAFCNCAKLRKLVFKKTPDKKAKALFAPQSNGSQLRTICTRAFYGCRSLAGVELPDGIEEIGIDAFRASGL